MAKGKLTLEAVNLRLKLAKSGVTVRQKGDRLYLRATLPPKPGSAKALPHQQDIALKIYANPAGLERAEAEARKLSAAIACKEFDWSLYTQPTDKPLDQLTVRELVERFRISYMASHSLTDRTWKGHWWKIYKRLSQDTLPTPHMLVKQVLKTQPDTRDRKQTCDKLQKLADFAGLEVNLKPYAGNYSSSKAKPRDLPTDEMIMEWRDRIPNPTWQWLYGMLAAYGLRPHEAMFCEFPVPGKPLLQVLAGKTGPRDVYPLYPEWVQLWDLWTMQPPNITGKNYEDYGDRICKALRKRYKLPFVPYDLRHAYAVRASVIFKFPVAVAAAYMGHSPTVHWNLYNRWISQDQYAQEFERQMSRSDRPLPPPMDTNSDKP